jgi:hypothetical protein
VKSLNRRTIFLAVLATATFVWAAIDRFDVPPEELATLLLYCVYGVVTMAVLAAIVFALVLGLARLRRVFWPGPD